MAAPRTIVLVLCLCLAAACLGLWPLVSKAYESPLPYDFAGPAPDSMTFDASYDAYISSNTADVNYGDDVELWVGLFSSGATQVRRQTLLWFDISALPAEAIIDSATLELAQIQADGETAYQIWPHQVTGAWAEATVTWASAPAAASAGDPAATLTYDPGVKTWDVSHIVQTWQAGAQNLGILLLGDATTVGYRVFRSRENSGGPGHLTIHYHISGADTPTPTATVTHTPTPTVTPDLSIKLYLPLIFG